MSAVEVDPAKLKLPTSRFAGADPFKLHRQIVRFGSSMKGMPRPIVMRSSDGELVLFDGVTRATRIAKLLPGQTISVEVADDIPDIAAGYPAVEDRI